MFCLRHAGQLFIETNFTFGFQTILPISSVAVAVNDPDLGPERMPGE